MKYYYIITKNSVFFKSSKIQEKGDLSSGPTIYKFPSTFKAFHIPIDIEGPFISIEYLKKYSTIYTNLKINNPKRAQKIIKHECIQEIIEVGKIKKGQEYTIDEIESIVHGMFGTFKKEIVTGVHFFDENKVRIIEHYGTEKNGVFSAKIEIYSHYRKEWITKKEVSTFFPITWDSDKLLLEIIPAFENKVKVNGTDFKYQGLTKSNISVEFIIKKNKITTFYPIKN